MGRHAPIGRHGEDVAQPVAAATAAYSVVFTTLNNAAVTAHTSAYTPNISNPDLRLRYQTR